MIWRWVAINSVKVVFFLNGKTANEAKSSIVRRSNQSKPMMAPLPQTLLLEIAAGQVRHPTIQNRVMSVLMTSLNGNIFRVAGTKTE